MAGHRLAPDAAYPETGWLVGDARPRTYAGRGAAPRLGVHGRHTLPVSGDSSSIGA
ncbi:hypothetical protein [Phytohabitans flavus]|uniref:hypothetical protein n=1 Tax=Phytohabitans flavus TaxID=1076124 RepID=UPI00366C52BC